MFQKQEYLNYLPRHKLFRHYERQKLVQAGSPWRFLFLIRKLQDLTSSSSKLLEKLLFLKCYIGLCVPKTRLFEINPRSKLFHPHKREKYALAGAPSVLLFLIGKLQDLTSSCSKLIEALILLNSSILWIKYSARSKLLHQHERHR